MEKRLVDRKRVLKQFTLKHSEGVSKYEETEILEDKDGNQSTGSSSELKIDQEAPTHDDLRKAMRQLTFHMLAITEQIGTNIAIGTLRQSDDKEHPIEKASHNIEGLMLTDSEWAILREADCVSIKIDGVGDDEKITLSGSRWLERIGGTLSISTPQMRYGTGYKYDDELAELIENIKHEVYLYAFERKYQPPVQTEINFPQSKDDANYLPFTPELGGLTVESVTTDGDGTPTITLSERGKNIRTPNGGGDF